MNSRTLIFSKRFPKITQDMLNEFEDVSKSDNADTDFPKTGEEFISYMEENTKYIFNEERAKHKDEFIALVKELSENYEIDTDLYEVVYGYIAYLHWDFAICNGYLKELFAKMVTLCDSFDLFNPDDESYDCLMSFEFCTHDKYFKGRKID